MQALQEIKIVELLYEREQELLKIHQLEEAVRATLNGENYPFPEPPEMPSLMVKMKKGRKKQSNKKNTEKHDFIRKLQSPGENAYRIVFEYQGEEKESFQNDEDLLKTLLTFPNEAVNILKIETVFFRNQKDWHKQALLWEQSEMTQ